MVIEEYPETHGDYRYLWRKRGLDIGGKVDLGEAVFLMRNPATEEEKGEKGNDDRRGRHTTRNICRTIAQRLGYTTFTEINMFALRAKDMPTLREAHSKGRNLDFTHFKRHKRGNLQGDGTERPGVPEYLGQLQTVKNLPAPATGGAAQE